MTKKIFRGALLGARCFGRTVSYFSNWNRRFTFWKCFWKGSACILAECFACCQEQELMSKLSQCQVKAQLFNHSIVATTSHLEKVLILCRRCTSSYGIYVCKRIMRPALACRRRRKTICWAHLLSDTTVTSNYWKMNMFIRTTNPSFFP